MRLILAPMEGLADPSLRDILTRLGGIDLCVDVWEHAYYIDYRPPFVFIGFHVTD